MNSSREGYVGMLEEVFLTQYGDLMDVLGGTGAIEAFMIRMKESDALLNQTHAFIISQAVLAYTQQHTAAEGPVSNDWKAVVRAVIPSVRVSVVSVWPDEFTPGEHDDILINWHQRHSVPGVTGRHWGRQAPTNNAVSSGRNPAATCTLPSRGLATSSQQASAEVAPVSD